jgi:internalin A
MPQDLVFISYSHKDIKWRDELQKHLKPYLRGGSIVSWSDQQIDPGSEWFKEIHSALTNSKVAVLLVSPDFIASDFIHEHELGPLLKEAEQGGVKILWVPVRESAYKQTPLKKYQAVLDASKPLAGMTKAKRDPAWVKICEKIEGAVNPRSKLERDVKQVKEQQARQEQEISGIKIALKGILTTHELGTAPRAEW